MKSKSFLLGLAFITSIVPTLAVKAGEDMVKATSNQGILTNANKYIEQARI
jgi:hypothetical protein